MTDWAFEHGNELVGLMAYDHGALDSGIHDEELRTRLFAQLTTMSEVERPGVLARVAMRWLDAPATEAGYGIEDVVRFSEWLDEHGIDY